MQRQENNLAESIFNNAANLESCTTLPRSSGCSERNSVQKTERVLGNVLAP